MTSLGRNDPCPCGSGKKFKQCCLGKAALSTPPADAPAIRRSMQSALELHRAGQLAQAEALYRQILTQAPRHADALHFLGLIAHQCGRHERALELILRAIEIKGGDAGFYNNLGLVYEALHRPEEAVTAYRRAVEVNPDFVESWSNLGHLLTDRGRIAEAVRCLRRAIALRPGFAEAWCNLGRALGRHGEFEEAICHCRQALSLRPDMAEAHSVLGNIYQKQERLEEAAACFRQALILKPDDAGAHFNLASTLLLQGRPDEAAAFCSKGLALRADDAAGCHYLGYAQLFRGDPDAAISSCERALSFKPDHAAAFDTRLFAMLYRAATTPAEILSEHRRYADRFETPLRPRWPRHRNGRDPDRRLKVGYVSPDFRYHSVAFFIEPLLARHDRAEMEVHCYHSHGVHDAVSDRLARLADRWIPCAGLSDDGLAERIRADGIDILVDLAGHTGSNRLLVFARKPAPVQVTYLGYPTTTGLSAMDWRLTTFDVDPQGSEQWYTERLYRLPRTLWCYRSPQDPLDRGGTPPTLAPGLSKDHVTFGSMNQLAKVSEETVRVWAMILRELPDSRLVMTSIPEGAARDRLKARFSSHGVSSERLELHGRLPGQEFQALMRNIDLALDPFPYNGTTTTCEALWMGLPVITLIGKTSVSRSGYAILKTVGLEEFCAKDEAEYARLAVELARDPPRLDALRRGMRARIEASPLCDETGFARDVERAYRAMWREWCETSA
jgi:protein O-GlcNAc transferase